MTRTVAASALAALLVALGSLPAAAQDDNAPRGVKTKGLVTSLGGFSATISAPVVLTGSTVELAAGGQTGRQQFRVPTYVYVIDGILTTNYEAGPVGIKGVQYHAAGQSFMDNGGWWHNHTNRTDKPVKYLILHVGYPGAAAPVQKPDAD
jgi:hypothetical protein